jgi:light-regulated signal transduction histidine kinase (bacteriophytochrome)
MDITERKRIEADLRQRTEELARSNEDLQRFAYTASHDIQEPLRGISAYTELLARKYMSGDAQADQYVKFIRDGVNRIRILVQDLLEYSKVANEGAVPDKPVSFDAVLNDAVRNLRASVEESGANISFSGLPAIAADERQMVQLLQNLIGNAIKYRTPERVPEVTISAEYGDGCWTFCVADNGIGIDMAQAQRIFGVFQRLHTNEQYPGTGIGLAICERIVTRHGGKIWVQSVPGHGSKFLFTLPFTRTRAEPQAAATSRA